MSNYLKWLCCCCDFATNNPELPHITNENKQQHKPPVAKPSRLATKYCRQDFKQLGQEERKKETKAYCCPICFIYFKRILACGECFNFICLPCYQLYDRKNKAERQEMKCPFCASSKSKFIDYQLDPHSYFDASKQGCFITKQQRSRLDQEISHIQATNHQMAPSDPPGINQPLPDSPSRGNL